MSEIIRECKKIIKQAKKLKGTSYPINPGGRHIAPKTGNLILVEK